MDCNKDDATKAKEIAEKKMESKDFVGAKKFATKAQQLYSGLDGISQILTVCDVHCAAQQRVLGMDMDWYGILQVEILADEALIKKQYRKLALLLHPDKNKLPGAETAFKLIGEAHGVLSDSSKRSTYDLNCKTFKGQQKNSAFPFQRQPGVNISSGRAQYTSVNLVREQNQPGPDRPTFWTVCPFCNMRYEYYRDLLNRALRCQKCTKPFIGYDLNVQGVPSGANWTQPVVLQPNEVKQDGGSEGIQTTNMGFSSNPSYQPQNDQQPTASNSFQNQVGTSKVNKKSKMEAKHNNVNGAGRTGKHSRSETRNRSRKRRKTIVDSSDSCATESGNGDDELEILEDIDSDCIEQNSGRPEGSNARRSARQKRQVVYNEDSDDDFLGTSMEDKPFSPAEDQGDASLDEGTSNVIKPDGFSPDIKERDFKEHQNSTPFEESLHNGDFQDDTRKKKGKAPVDVDDSDEEFKISKTSINGDFQDDTREKKGKAPVDVDDSDEEFKISKTSINGDFQDNTRKKKGKAPVDVDDSDEEFKISKTSKSNFIHDIKQGPEFIEVADPELYEFDNDRKENCFANDQMWAVYDSVDGMPRFYARIRKVFSPGFKVKITWLEASPDNQDEINWLNGGLPVSCGLFKHDKNEITEEINMFSHLVAYEKGSRRNSILIYPKKGETWALFKNWDIKWSSDPDSYRNYEYEFVEILSDYSEQSGTYVSFLEKERGFVSLYRPKKGAVATQILPNQLYRFSHRVPSYKTTGKERDGVPEGSFELDPASLPEKVPDPEAV